MKAIIKFLKEKKIVLLALIILLPIICITSLNISNTSGDKKAFATSSIEGQGNFGFEKIEIINSTNNEVITDPEELSIDMMCGEVQEETELPHKESNWITSIEPTTEREGYKYKFCLECGILLESVTLNKLLEVTPSGHTPKFIAEKSVTCTTEGNIEYYECKDCNKYFEDDLCTKEIEDKDSVIISALGHDLEKVEAKSAGCTTEGNIEYYECTRCTRCFEDEACTKLILYKYSATIPALGHNSEKVEAKSAECTTEGNIEYYECTRCNKYFEEEACKKEIINKDSVIISVLGHKPSAVVEENRVDATCTTECRYDEVVYCSECNAEISRETKTTPEVGHEFGYWIVEKPATYEEDGKQYRICASCGAREEEVLPKLVNNNPAIIFTDYTTVKVGDDSYVKLDSGLTVEEIKANMDANGIAGQTVTVENLTNDGKVKTGSEVKLNGETVYTVVISGDLDGDGKVSFMGDVVAANNYRIGKVELSTIQQLAADISNNGKVDFIQDIVRINNYRLGIINSL